jgi:hypothetical protein
LLVVVGIIVTALVAPLAEGKPLLAGSKQSAAELTPTVTSTQAEASWDDVLAGAAAGVVIAFLVMRALRAVRGVQRQTALDAEA